MDNENVKENKPYYKYSESGIKSRNFDLWSIVSNYTDIKISFKEKFYLYENKMSELPKCECGGDLKFIDMISGFRRFCSKKCMLNSEEIKSNKKKTCIEKYGVDNPSKSNEIKNKVKETNLEKFGVEYPLQSEEILSKLKSDSIRKWGVDNPSKIKEIRDKAKLTNKDRFGVEHAMQNEEIKSSLVNYFIDKYGVDNPSKLESTKEKRVDTMLSRYSTEHPLFLDEFKQKSKNTSLNRYGVENYSKTREFREKSKKTNLEKYGFENYSQTKEFKEKSKKTNLEKYGVENYSQTKEFKEKLKSIIFEKNTEIVNREGYELIHMDESEYKIKCIECNKEFNINRQLWRSRVNMGIKCCLHCNPITNGTSRGEKEILKFIKDNYTGEIIENYKLKKEIDIYLPDLKLGFEYNGLYWHSELNKSKEYHVEKYNYFRELGIQIISFWEDDWLFKTDIVKSIILNKLVRSSKVMARKCQIKELNEVKDNSLIREFLDNNHIQGFIGSKIKIGLFFEGELVSLMTFGELRKSLGQSKQEDVYEMLRFCNKINTTVVGGSSKIFNFFLKKYKPKQIISYSDNSRSTGGMYEKMKFELESESFGNYFWYKDLLKFHRFNFRKDKLVKMGFDKTKTEVEIMHERGYYRIWDYGQKKWIYSMK